jgi:hypothetical protein
MAGKTEAETTQTEYGPSHAGRDPASGRSLGPRIMTPVQARQGVVSGRVVTVLGISVTLAVLGMVLAFVLL